MSSWTYVNGVIKVDINCRTSHEGLYIINTVIDHLPIVPGSEHDMSVKVIPDEFYGSYSTNTDEFGRFKTDQIDSMEWHCREVQFRYTVIVDGQLRDTVIESTRRKFYNWLVRLAKRVMVTGVLVNIRDCYHHSETIARFDNDFIDMYDGDNPWYDYLMWDESKLFSDKITEDIVRKYNE